MYFFTGEFLVVPLPSPSQGEESLWRPRSMLALTPSEATAGLYVFETVRGDAVVVGPTHMVQDSKQDR